MLRPLPWSCGTPRLPAWAFWASMTGGQNYETIGISDMCEVSIVCRHRPAVAARPPAQDGGTRAVHRGGAGRGARVTSSRHPLTLWTLSSARGVATTVGYREQSTDSHEPLWFPVSRAATALVPCQPLTTRRWHHGWRRREMHLTSQSRSVSRRREWRGAARDPARPDGALRESPARYLPRRTR
jgi:hypothetical protein